MIEPMLVLSTAHVSDETCNTFLPALKDTAVFQKGDYGYFVYVTEDTDGMPTDLEACIHLARAKGCNWLMLDRDGGTVAELPTFDWLPQMPAYHVEQSIKQIGDGRWYGGYCNWHLSLGEADQFGRLPLKAAFYSHTCQDGSDDRFGWVDTIDEAKAAIDAMPGYSDSDGDFD